MKSTKRRRKTENQKENQAKLMHKSKKKENQPKWNLPKTGWKVPKPDKNALG